MTEKNNNNIKKIILDTNFLLLPGQFRFDIFSEIQQIMNHKYKLFIIDKTIDELEKIKSKSSKSKQKDKIAANIALELLKLNDVEEISSENCKGPTVDDFIVELADENTFICTNDKELKFRLLDKGFTIIELMKKSYLRIKRKRKGQNVL